MPRSLIHRYECINCLYVSSILQRVPTWRLCLRDACSINGRNRMAQRLIVEWSTDTPRSFIILQCAGSSADRPRTNGCKPG
jgi:hypothetical protein